MFKDYYFTSLINKERKGKEMMQRGRKTGKINRLD